MEQTPTQGRTHWWAIAAMVAAMALWGASPVGTRFLVVNTPPALVLMLRFLLAGVLFAPAIWGKRVARADWGRLALATLLAAGYYVPLTYGLRWVTASVGSLLTAMESVLVAFAAVWLLGERPRWQLWLGTAVALGGQLVLTLRPGSSDSAHPWLGALLVLLGAASWGVHTAVVKPLTSRYSALHLTGLLTVGVLVLLLPLGSAGLISAASTLTWQAWSAIVLLAVGSTVLGLLLWNVGLQGMSASRAGVYMYLVPLFGLLGGWLALGEAISLPMLAGGVLILAGVGLAEARGVTPRVTTGS